MEALPWRVLYEVPCPEVVLGEHRFDVRYRALVMGILDGGPSLDALLARARDLVAAGADAIDVGEVEDPERVAPAIEAIRDRFDLPIAVATGGASSLQAALDAGAVVGRDSSGFADPDYLAVAAAGSASVVATHLRTDPAEPEVDSACRSLGALAEQAEAAGILRDRVLIEADLDLLGANHRLAELGWPLLLSTPGTRDVGDVVGTHALGISLGCRVLRVHDVKGARRTADVMAAILEARAA